MSFALMDERRHPRLRRRTHMTPTIVIRSPRSDEDFAVRRLAYLDSRRPLRGDVLVAFVDGEPLAAVSLADGTVVADPFRHTADIVELLRLRAELQVDGTSSAGRLGGLRPRLAA
jgi:hypothetical protein